MIIKMYKKIIFTLLLFLVPIAFIEQPKNDNSSQIISNKYDLIEKNNFLQINSFFEVDKDKRIEIKKCWEKGDLLSQKLYCSSNENFFHNF